MFRKLSASDVPKRPRKASSRFERSDEWKQMKELLDRGLKPNDALEIVFTADDKAKLRIKNRRTVARFIQQYITTNKLPYKLKSFHRDSADFFLVMHPPKSPRG